MKGIRIQAKRHTLTYTDINPVEPSGAEIPYQPSKAQLGFHGGEEIYIPAHRPGKKVLSPSAQQYQLFTQGKT